MFITRKSLRLTAATVLLAWLFALTAGVAQACVVQMAPQDHCALMGADAEAAEAGDHHPAEPGWKAACDKFCAETPLPTPALKPAPDLPDGGLAWLLPPLAPGLSHQLLALRQGTPGPAPGAAQHAGSAIPIAFLRLAL